VKKHRFEKLSAQYDDQWTKIKPLPQAALVHSLGLPAIKATVDGLHWQKLCVAYSNSRGHHRLLGIPRPSRRPLTSMILRWPLLELGPRDALRPQYERDVRAWQRANGFVGVNWIEYMLTDVSFNAYWKAYALSRSEYILQNGDPSNGGCSLHGWAIQEALYARLDFEEAGEVADEGVIEDYCDRRLTILQDYLRLFYPGYEFTLTTDSENHNFVTILFGSYQSTGGGGFTSIPDSYVRIWHEASICHELSHIFGLNDHYEGALEQDDVGVQHELPPGEDSCTLSGGVGSFFCSACTFAMNMRVDNLIDPEQRIQELQLLKQREPLASTVRLRGQKVCFVYDDVSVETGRLLGPGRLQEVPTSRLFPRYVIEFPPSGLYLPLFIPNTAQAFAFQRFLEERIFKEIPLDVAIIPVSQLAGRIGDLQDSNLVIVGSRFLAIDSLFPQLIDLDIPILALGSSAPALFGKMGLQLGNATRFSSQHNLGLVDVQRLRFETTWPIHLRGGYSGALGPRCDLFAQDCWQRNACGIPLVDINQNENLRALVAGRTDPFSPICMEYNPEHWRRKRVLWGFEGSPDCLSPEGKQLFRNLVGYLMGIGGLLPNIDDSGVKPFTLLCEHDRFFFRMTSTCLLGYEPIQIRIAVTDPDTHARILMSRSNWPSEDDYESEGIDEFTLLRPTSGFFAVILNASGARKVELAISMQPA
jgi:hypothetical protein